MDARLVLVMLAIAPSARAEPLRLADVLERVVERGPDQAVAAGQVAVARADVHSAKMLPNPGVLVGGSTADPIFSASLQIHLPIFGQRGAHVRAAERGVDESAAGAAWARWKLRHDARIAYYAVGRAEEEVAIAVEIEGLTRRVADMAQEKYQVGTGTRLDERQSALAHVRALQDVSDRRALARIARLELARLVGVPVETLGAPADALATVGDTPPLDTLLGELTARHPELRTLAAERAHALAQAGAARAERRPLPTLEVGVDISESPACGPALRCVSPRAALGFDLPVLNLNGGPIERAEAEARLAELKAQAATVRVESAVRAAQQALDAAAARARFFDAEYVPSALAVETMASEGFAVGRTGLLPLIEATRAVLEARLGRTEALYAVQAARADLEEASGVALSAP